MDDAWKKLSDWADEAQAYEPVSWERLPELELYMDQVITLMNRQLSLFQWDEEKVLTSSMINNYVKGGVLPRPNQKKYGREHLAMLHMICMLKSILSLPEIDETMQGLDMEKRVPELYAEFSAHQGAALREVSERMRDMPDNSRETLFRLATELALEANARRAAAARILDALKAEETRDGKESKETKKEKSKKEPPAGD